LKLDKYRTLPITEKGDLKRQEWSYLYAYNIRTLRDVFVYCALSKGIDETKLYEDMEANKIPPPKDRWINKRRKREERLRLEYIHAADYLGFIKRKNGWVQPNCDDFKKEKRVILKENKNRLFNIGDSSPPLTSKEKSALLKIIFNYERARDFLRWFLDFSEFPNIQSFTLDEFKEKAKPIFILGKIEKREKGSRFLNRDVDGKTWIIPNDYIRLASGVFPGWFMELGFIDKVVVFPEFSGDKKLWHMLYPIKIEKDIFLKINMPNLIMKMFLNRDKKEMTVWIPYLIYVLAKKYYAPVEVIKISIERTCKSEPSSFYLERVPAHLMKSKLKYKQSYLEVNGFFRSYLKIIRR
jgi:hypothetical protein